MELLIWGLLLAGLAGLILAGAYVCYRVAFYNNDHTEDIFGIPSGEQYAALAGQQRTLAEEMVRLPCEPVEIRSQDGLRLAGRYYPLTEGGALQIEFHGYRGGAIRDFCGGNQLAREMGMNTLVVDQRAHGKSQGKTITFGVMERYDCLAWCRYAAERFGKDVPIFLAGVSMGAATVLMASALDLPENVVGILADSPYTTPSAIIEKVCRDGKLPAKPVLWLTALGARLYGGFSLTAASAEQAVRRAKVPLLVIHGEDDRFVPCQMSRRLQEANPERVTLVTVPGAGHGLSYLVDRDRYASAVRAFAAHCLEQRSST